MRRSSIVEKGGVWRYERVTNREEERTDRKKKNRPRDNLSGPTERG